MSSKQKRHDADIERIKRVLELRRSNAAAPIPSKSNYKRRPKHKEW